MGAPPLSEPVREMCLSRDYPENRREERSLTGAIAFFAEFRLAISPRAATMLFPLRFFSRLVLGAIFMFRYAAIFSLLLTPLLVADDKPRFAGPTEKGFLLPNGWTLTP